MPRRLAGFEWLREVTIEHDFSKMPTSAPYRWDTLRSLVTIAVDLN
jgi:hypothetical protein